jgi:protein SFI1
LQEWAKDAEFYFLATKTLKRWKASTESTQREKRRTAYVEVRRMIKVNLVRGVLQKWREQAHHILELQAQTVEVRQNRDVILGMEIFDRWRGRAEELLELESLARETFLKKHFNVWKEKSDGLQALETEAIITYQERRQKIALKKWSLVSLQLRAQSNYASDICEKNAKKTFRKILNYWHQKALQRRPLQRVSASESDQLLGTTARAETWSDYGEGDIDEWARGLDEATTSTPIPGYLATPSKVNRAERVMAAAARFSTTPKAPLSTPFERQLRAQYPGGFASSRRGIGRSTLGLGRGFVDISEHSNSMKNERESRG